MKYTEEQIRKLLNDIYNGVITEYDLPDDLYYAIADYLQTGMFKGFGKNLETAAGADLELLNELNQNVWMFSAAKTFQQVKDIRSLLFDEEGKLISVNQFLKAGREAYDNWNNNWGRSEYETAVGNAQMAVKWNQIQEQKDVLPILVFDTDGQACPECAPYEGFTAPADDPVWNWLMPLLHFNCHCTVKQEAEGYPVSSDEEYKKVADSRSNIDDVFQMNPGKDKIIFSKEHPYFQVEKKDRKFAKENFGLPLPKEIKEK